MNGQARRGSCFCSNQRLRAPAQRSLRGLAALGMAALILVACAEAPTGHDAVTNEAAAMQTGDLRLSYAMPEADGQDIPYRVYLPSNWTTAREWPLLMMLHGYSGTADSPFDDAGGLLQQQAEKHGFVVVSPNGYNGMADYGANLPLPSELDRPGDPATMSPQEESALAEADVRHVLERTIKDYAIDQRRIYLMGNSMGMTGVLHFARTDPERWCAISASGGPPWPDYPVEQLGPITGALLVHGALDNIARPADTQALTQKMQAAGIDARMQLIEDGTHGNAWVKYLPETFDFFAARDCVGQ